MRVGNMLTSDHALRVVVTALAMLLNACATVTTIQGVRLEEGRTASLYSRGIDELVALDRWRINPPLDNGGLGREYIVPAGEHRVVLDTHWASLKLNWQTAEGEPLPGRTRVVLGFVAEAGRSYAVRRQARPLEGFMVVAIEAALAPYIVDEDSGDIVSWVIEPVHAASPHGSPSNARSTAPSTPATPGSTPPTRPPATPASQPPASQPPVPTPPSSAPARQAEATPESERSRPTPPPVPPAYPCGATLCDDEGNCFGADPFNCKR